MQIWQKVLSGAGLGLIVPALIAYFGMGHGICLAALSWTKIR